jgi:hypothetical protein
MKAAANVLILVGVLNFAALITTSMSIGGSADPEASRNGRFFLSDHGTRTEVDESAYRFSLIHSRSVFITHPLAILGFVLLMAEDMKKHPDRLARRFH